MSCCGGKRKEWLRKEKPVATQSNKVNEPVGIDKRRDDRIFEYTGNSSLQIKGSISGKVYNFRFPGEKISVSRADSWALMADKDLRLVR